MNTLKIHWIKILWGITFIIAIVIFGCFINTIATGSYLITTNGTVLIHNNYNWLINLMILLFSVVILIPMYDLLTHMLKIGKYKEKVVMPLYYKALKVIFNYSLLLVITFLTFFLLEFTFDYNDKTSELEYYSDIAQSSVNRSSIVKYENKYFFNSKKYLLWNTGTMFNEGEGKLTQQFEHLKTSVNRENLNRVISFNSDNLGNYLIENFYFTVQTVSTLGYGNITPNTPIGMMVVSISVLFGQFITIIGATLIIRD